MANFIKCLLPIISLLISMAAICSSNKTSKTDKPLHIAHVGGLNVEIPTYGVGGLEKVVEVLIFEQLKSGHKVTLFCTDDSGQLTRNDLHANYGEKEEMEAIIAKNFRIVKSGSDSLHIHTRNYAEYVDEVNKAKITVNEEHKEGRKVKHVKKVLNYEGYVKRFLQIVLDHVDGTETPELGPIDVVHFHSMDHFEYGSPLLLEKQFNDRLITTMHMSLEDERIVKMLSYYPAAKMVSISDNQRRYMAKLPGKPNYKPNFVDTVYNAYPEDLYPFMEMPEPKRFSWDPEYNFGTPSKDGVPYLAFIGRFSSDKGVGHAIQIALKAGMELRIAAKITDHERDYRESLKEGADPKLIKFIGEVKGDKQKQEFLGNAMAMLFPIEWQEPFGLVQIESMSSGTPVIAPNTASVPEIITPEKYKQIEPEKLRGGYTFEVKTHVKNRETRVIYNEQVYEEAANLVKQLRAIKANEMREERQKVRDTFVKYFTGPVMVQSYDDLYKKLINGEEEGDLANENGVKHHPSLSNGAQHRAGNAVNEVIAGVGNGHLTGKNVAQEENAAGHGKHPRSLKPSRRTEG